MHERVWARFTRKCPAGALGREKAPRQILDIVEETIVSRSPSSRPGVLFSAVIQGRVTEFLDIEGILSTVDPVFFEKSDTAHAEV